MFFCFVYWVFGGGLWDILSSAQELLLILHSESTPGRFGGPDGYTVIELRSVPGHPYARKTPYC